jgi:hypothetical protein
MRKSLLTKVKSMAMDCKMWFAIFGPMCYSSRYELIVIDLLFV